MTTSAARDDLGLRRLTRQERIALGIVLNGSLDALSRAATGMLAEYRERYWLRWYGEMIGETAELADLVRELPPRIPLP
jgi:hypothetical protein